jgi:hypothetical protein
VLRHNVRAAVDSGLGEFVSAKPRDKLNPAAVVDGENVLDNVSENLAVAEINAEAAVDFLVNRHERDIMFFAVFDNALNDAPVVVSARKDNHSVEHIVVDDAENAFCADVVFIPEEQVLEALINNHAVFAAVFDELRKLVDNGLYGFFMNGSTAYADIFQGYVTLLGLFGRSQQTAIKLVNIFSTL